jgi:hypothetical protein
MFHSSRADVDIPRNRALYQCRLQEFFSVIRSMNSVFPYKRWDKKNLPSPSSSEFQRDNELHTVFTVGAREIRLRDSSLLIQ